MKIAMKTTLIQHSIIITALFLIKLSFAEIGFGDSTLFTRRSFPHGFIFGVASAAYQYEGAAFEDGKGPSIWDNFTHQFPEKIADRSNGDVATNFYNLYKEDVKLLKHIGVDTFRMSISWPRILPCGKLSGGVNKEGIVFYNKVFNELIANGIMPFVTLFHWDVPQALEDEYGGFLSPLIIDDFRDFAELCFKEFGDRVKYWTTFNEPNGFASSGYVETFVGNYAPGRCSNRSICSQGNSATEPYVVGHHQLLSHAVVVKLYRTKYQGTQKGKIGMSLVTPWFVPYSNSKLDVKATQRALDFNYGWFADPIFYGNYPKIMQSLVGDRLPNFTTKQSEMLKGSFDFFGLNYYTGIYAAHVLSRTGNISSETDSLVRLSFARNGVPIRGPSGYPKGLHDLLIYTKHKYNNPTIYITENGVSDNNNGTQDLERIDFYRSHLQAIQKATEEGVNVKGFMAWSFLDDFEWVFGYTQRYGLCHVDYNNRLNRILKQSAIWFKNSLSNG